MGPASSSEEFLQRALQRGRALLELGRPQAALAEVQKALSAGHAAGGRGLSGPGPGAEALQLLGLCFIRLSDPVEARRALESAVASDPADAHGHYLLGYALGEGKEKDGPERAFACYREALRLSPEQPVYLRALAEALVARKEFTAALALAHKAVALAPDRANNHITLGFVASSAGNRSLARLAYEQALAIEPNNSLAWNNLGCVDLAQGLPLHARERFREALRLDPVGSIAQDNYDLVKPKSRPHEVHRDHAAFERQLVVEVWENVLFAKNRKSPGRHPDEARVHAVAILWATSWRGLPAVWWKAPSLLTWLGVSAGLLRLGPAGIAVALSSLAGLGAVGATALARSRLPLRQRREVYQDQLAIVQQRWERVQNDWLAGSLARQQRDEAQGRLIDEFCRFVESQLAELGPDVAPLDKSR